MPSTTLEANPQVMMPAYNPIKWIIDNSNKNEPGFRYIFTIFPAGSANKIAQYIYAALHILLRDHRERGAAVRVAAMAAVAAHDPESAIAWANSVEKSHTVDRKSVV